MKSKKNKISNLAMLFSALLVSGVFLAAPRAEAGDLLLNSRGPEDSAVLRYDGTTGAFIGEFVPSTSGGLLDPYNMAWGPDGNLYVTEIGTGGVVFRYDGTTGDFIDIFVQWTGLGYGVDLAFGPDCNLYVAHAPDDKIVRYNGTTGAFMDDFVPAGSGGLDSPHGVAFGPDGNLYVADQNGDRILRYSGETGMFIDEFVAAGSGDLDRPTWFLFRPDGRLYVASNRGGIKTYDGTTGAFIDTFVAWQSGGLGLAQNFDFGSDGRLYVVNSGGSGNGVKRYDGATGAFIDDFVIAPSGGLERPTGLLFLPATPPACGCSDADGDGFGLPGSAACAGGSAEDCSDLDSSVFPGAPELCDGKDNDCDEVVPGDEADLDEDGFRICEDDCDDSDAQLNPDALELPGNAVDENCDGSLGACDPGAEWRNHGQFVRCVAHEVNDLVEAGLISEDEGDELVRNAAQSDVGK